MARQTHRRPPPWYVLVLWAAGALALLAGGAYVFLVQTDALPNPMQRRPAPAPPPAATRDDRWAQDVAYLAAELPALHRNAFFQVDEAAFRAEAEALAAQVPTSSDVEIMIGMARLAALIGDGHTAVQLADPERLRRFPLRLAWFGDDLVVTEAAPDHREALGARVTHIGNTAVADALAAVAPLIAHDNAQQLRMVSADVLLVPEILAALDILPGAEVGRFRLELPDGATRDLEVAPVRANAEVDLLTLYEAGGIAPPLASRGEGRLYWYEHLPAQRAVYVHYARCADDPRQPFAAFSRELFALIDSRQVERVIVDLRFNGGGDSRVFQPFIAGLRERPGLNRRGQVYVLIGGRTFSSAMMNAIELKTRTNSILLGEPTGGRPNGYGEVRSFRLPNAGLRVTYSTRFFTNLPGSDAPALAPDIPAPIRWRDLLAGADPAVDMALAGVLPP